MVVRGLAMAEARVRFPLPAQKFIIKIMVEVKRKPGESVLSLVKRFSTKVRLSGILIEVKKGIHYQKPLNKRARKEKALLRLQRQKEAMTSQKR